jgi:hypothetical protein
MQLRIKNEELRIIRGLKILSSLFVSGFTKRSAISNQLLIHRSAIVQQLFSYCSSIVHQLFSVQIF